MNKPYSILLYYCYTPIADPEEFREQHHLMCLELNLLGRIIVSKEGLNGTVSGLKEDCEKYMEIMHADPRFAKIDFKVDKTGIVHAGIGKASFEAGKIAENARELLSTLVKLKPQAAKGVYIKSVYLSSTMSPSLEIDTKRFTEQ